MEEVIGSNPICSTTLVMKKIFRKIVISILWWQVSRLRKKHDPKVIGVAGSVGKTTTKQAVANVLSEKHRVVWEEGNYNDVVSIPLVFFNKRMPSLFNVFSWLKLLVANEIFIHKTYPYDVVVLELGTDHPGDMAQLEGHLELDILALTAITPEHMENFSDLDDVAKDELIATKISKQTIVDSSSVDKKYIKEINSPTTIGTSNAACVIKAGKLDKNALKRQVEITYSGGTYSVKTPLIGKQNLPSLAFAVVIAKNLGLNKEQVLSGLSKIAPVNGRMNLLRGKHDSILIDDTYNASPEAMKNALDTLSEIEANQKIAVLGQMNELGKFSKELHEEVGSYCGPKDTDLILTIGADSNNYLAGSAEQNGCKVQRCKSPYEAAGVIESLLNKDTVVLIKGSQNGVFAEETTKLLLAKESDVSELVRQSSEWLKTKKEQFSSAP